MSELRMQFKGTKNYIATEDLKMAERLYNHSKEK